MTSPSKAQRVLPPTPGPGKLDEELSSTTDSVVDSALPFLRYLPPPKACKVRPTSRAAASREEDVPRQEIDPSLNAASSKPPNPEHIYAALRSENANTASAKAEPIAVLKIPNTGTLLLTTLSSGQSDPSVRGSLNYSQCDDQEGPKSLDLSGYGSLKRISTSNTYGIELSPDSSGVLMIKFQSHNQRPVNVAAVPPWQKLGYDGADTTTAHMPISSEAPDRYGSDNYLHPVPPISKSATDE